MLASLRVELSKFYRHRSTYAGFVLLLAMSGLVVYGAAKDARNHERRFKAQIQRSLGGDFIVAGKIMSAAFVPRAILFAKLPVYVFVASLVAMAAGGAVASEYSAGTLRTLLSRPVRRTYVVLSKWLVNSGHAVSLTLFLGAAGLGLGYVFLGGGDLVWLDMQGGGGFQIVPEQEAIRSLAFAYGLQGLSMIAVASIALCISCAVGRGATAAGITVAFLLLSGMVGVLPFESLEKVQPYLLTTHMSTFEHVLDKTVHWAEIRNAALWVSGYAAAALLGAILIMNRREIKC
jgi:ABC-2 type transport system permease protein